MSVLWHYLQNGAAQGPIPEEQLRGLISSGVLRGSDQVWHEGMQEWAPLQSIPELAAQFPQGHPQPVAPQPGNGQPQAPRKSNKVLFWVLGGCGGLLLIVFIGMAVTFFWVKQKVGNLQRNPAVAAAELMVRANPELEVVATDYTKGTITMRNKKTGETLTLDAAQVKEGRFTFKDDKGSEVRIEALEGRPGTLQVQGPDGQATIGAGTLEQAPSWLPTYPGAAVEGVTRATSKAGSTGTVVQRTADAPGKVFETFEKTFKASGFTVGTIHTQEGGMVIGDQTATRRHVIATIGTNRGQTIVTLNYREGR